MSRKKNNNIANVIYSYVGTDEQFDTFLKLMLHDYLSVDDLHIHRRSGFGDNAEKRVS